MYICECGEEFEDLNEESQDHVLNFHRELVDSTYEDLIEEADFSISAVDAEGLFEDAILDVQDDLMDEIVEGD
jgi:hypothetical protein